MSFRMPFPHCWEQYFNHWLLFDRAYIPAKQDLTCVMGSRQPGCFRDAARPQSLVRVGGEPEKVLGQPAPARANASFHEYKPAYHERVIFSLAL